MLNQEWHRLNQELFVALRRGCEAEVRGIHRKLCEVEWMLRVKTAIAKNRADGAGPRR